MYWRCWGGKNMQRMLKISDFTVSLGQHQRRRPRRMRRPKSPESWPGKGSPMKKTRLLCLVLLLFPAFGLLYADSPITSTEFYTAYQNNPIVLKASESGVLTDEIARYLMDRSVGIGEKAAVVNALSWDISGFHRQNATAFMELLVKKYRMPKDKLQPEKCTADELLCLGYLTVLGDYSAPKKAIPFLEMALKKNPKSFTVNVILALTRAQELIDDTAKWCEIYKQTDNVRQNKTLKRDLKQEAIKIIFEYMDLYKDYCK